MAVTKVLSVVLLGLFGAALANPVADTTTAPTTTAGTGSTPIGLPGVHDYLSDADKEKVCKVPPTGPSFCAAAGPADDFCSKLAASVNGSTVCCVAPSVCSFKVAAPAGATTPAGTGPTSAAETTPVTTTAATTTAGTGPTTPAGTGATHPAGPAVVPQPDTVYISCNTAPAGFQQIKTCPNSKTIFVFPSAPGSPAGSDPAATGPTTPASGPHTTEE